jgi:hypothetical protein
MLSSITHCAAGLTAPLPQICAQYNQAGDKDGDEHQDTDLQASWQGLCSAVRQKTPRQSLSLGVFILLQTVAKASLYCIDLAFARWTGAFTTLLHAIDVQRFSLKCICIQRGENMDSAASRIVKARQYAKERDRRIKVHSFEVELHGDNANHLVSYDRADWTCDCEEFQLQGACAHSVTMEHILGDAVEPAIVRMPARMESAASRLVKARQYAEERDQRIRVHSFEVELHGDNLNHLITYDDGEWECDCEEFVLRGVCAHVMAMEQILGDAVEPALLILPVAA